jgi:hypothetical protein
MVSGRFSFVALILFCFIVGCMGDSKHGTLSGTVTLDGQPLKSGLIRLIPVDGQTASADATITDGKFSTTAPIGDKQVWISSPRVTGKRKAYDTPDSPTVNNVEELLPAQYNSASTIRAKVTAGNQVLKYELKSGK